MPRFFDDIPHFHFAFFPYHRKFPFSRRQQLLRRQMDFVEPQVLRFAYRCQMRSDVNSSLFQILPAKASGKDEGRCQTCRKMTSASHIVKPPVPHKSGIIRMPRPRYRSYIFIIRRMLILIGDHAGDRCSAGDVVQYAGQNLRQILLSPGSSRLISARSSPFHKSQKLVHIDLHTRGETVDHRADPPAVRFSEHRNFQFITYLR